MRAYVCVFAVFFFALTLFACSDQPLQPVESSETTDMLQAFEHTADGGIMELKEIETLPAHVTNGGIIDLREIETLLPAAKAASSSCSGYHDGGDDYYFAGGKVSEGSPACHEFELAGRRTIYLGFRVDRGEKVAFSLENSQGGEGASTILSKADGASFYSCTLDADSYKMNARFVDVDGNDTNSTSYVAVLWW